MLNEIDNNWITYKSSEVKVYHPICEDAINNALKKLRLDKDYYTLHHQLTGTLEMDFCIVNRHTGKYFCVIEVKRTPIDVNSARYQYQAMSYVQMNAELTEKPFYILTNLETLLTFRYDSERSRVFQQILKPGFTFIGSFYKLNKQTFIENLTNKFVEIFSSFINDNYEYSITLDDFAKHIYQLKNDRKKWKSHLAILLYEYIRGALAFVNRNDLKDIRLFNNNLSHICEEATKINFKDIFDYSDEKFEKNPNIDMNLVSQLFEFGRQNVSGDSIANVLHQIVSEGKEQNGEVPTDLELSRIVSVLAKFLLNKDIHDIIICDPAAGSGNLISSAIEIFNLVPTQIFVNDINPLLLELLSLRLGLNYPKIINPHNTVKITNKNISQLENDCFADVDVVILNPPFIAGIRCIDDKNILYNAIEKIKGTALTKYGQMPYEAPFLELLCSKLKTGTIISCILSKTLLLERGHESVIIRNFLLDVFGLNIIFTYPGNELFDNVTKDTCVLVGTVGKKCDNIKIITSYDNVPNINLSDFENAIKNISSEEFQNIMPGVQAEIIKYSALKTKANDGWRFINSELLEAVDFVSINVEQNGKFLRIDGEQSIVLKRGVAGNKGASDLIFCKDKDKIIADSDAYKLQFGIRNAKIDTFETEEGDSFFINVNAFSKNQINDIIEKYLKQPIRISRQGKNEKEADELYSILVKESSNPVKKGTILIPRDIRKKGRIYYTKKDMFVSTNFVICDFGAPEINRLYGSWMTTIFYQLICETASKDEAGTRKMEIADIEKTFIPKYSLLNSSEIDLILNATTNIDFIDLQNPVIREIDEIWSKILFGDKHKQILEKAQELLKYLANRRNT